MGRSVRELNPQEVLSLAIAVETRNAQRYETFGMLFRGYNDDASQLFEDMRDEELEHKASLLELYESRYGSDVCAIDEADVDEVVEAVDVEDAETLVFDAMTKREVLESALRAEQGAQQFYAGLSDSVKDEELLSMYRTLASYEDSHLAAIKNRIRELESETGGRNNGNARAH